MFLQNAVSLLDITPDYKCGKVLVTHEGIWGQICGDYFDDRSAAVVCRQLGMKGGRRPSMHYKDENEIMKTIWLDKFRCSGEETALDECYLSVKEGNCRAGAAFVCCDREVILNLHSSII
jgi:hypothetical protein